MQEADHSPGELKAIYLTSCAENVVPLSRQVDDGALW